MSSDIFNKQKTGASMSHSDRLKLSRKHLELSQQALADSLACKQGTIRDIEIGKQKIPQELALDMEKIHNISFKWLLTGEGDMLSVAETKELEIIKLPERGEVECSAGNGCYTSDETITGYISIDRNIIKQIGANIKTSEIVKVNGDSMSPTLKTGDKVLIDLSKKDIFDGKIYILRIEHTLFIKRLQKLSRGQIKVISDNKDFEPYTVDPQTDDFQVIGQILWLSRLIK